MTTLITVPAPTRRPRVLLGTMACLGLFIGAALTPLGPTAAAEMDTHRGVCHYDPAYLPHTADAIEGWYAQCRNRENTASSAGRPTTPDAIEGWLRHTRG